MSVIDAGDPQVPAILYIVYFSSFRLYVMLISVVDLEPELQQVYICT